MANLFIYGDSYSNDWSSAKRYRTERKEQGYYAREFEKENGREPTHFSDILKQKLGTNETFNFAGGGWCNYTIMEKICQTVHRIQPDDYVFIQWSDISRYRIVNGGNWHIKYLMDADSKQSVERVTDVTVREIENWSHLLKKFLPKKTFFWTPFHRQPFYSIDYLLIYKHLGDSPLIKDETNGNIEDEHWSDKGHSAVGEILYNAFINRNRLI